MGWKKVIVSGSDDLLNVSASTAKAFKGNVTGLQLTGVLAAR